MKRIRGTIKKTKSAVVSDIKEKPTHPITIDPITMRLKSPKNPYAMEPADAVRIAIRAGIPTPAGKLKKPYR